MTTASWSGITSANWCIFSDTPRGTVVNLPPRRPTDPHQVIAHLPEDTRPLPTVTAYDELLRRRQPDPTPASAEVHHHTQTGTP